jgi:CRP/FNR family transcriptional regulator
MNGMKEKLEASGVFDIFPILQSIDEPDWNESQPEIRSYPEKTVVFDAERCRTTSIFILEGAVKIIGLGENGREVIEARLTAGDVCALMVLSSLSEREYPGYMISETPIRVLFVRKSAFLKWIHVYPPLRNHIFEHILDGFMQLGQFLHNVLFESVEKRLTKWLLGRTATDRPVVEITHDELATELGTAREVVSRLLARFKKSGLIDTKRGQIIIVRREEMKRI